MLSVVVDAQVASSVFATAILRRPGDHTVVYTTGLMFSRQQVSTIATPVLCFSSIVQSVLILAHCTLKPYPLIQSLYLFTIPLQSSCGSSACENSMHSSRCDFSSLHTQQGFTFCVDSEPFGSGLRSEARLFTGEGWEPEDSAVC